MIMGPNLQTHPSSECGMVSVESSADRDVVTCSCAPLPGNDLWLVSAIRLRSERCAQRFGWDVCNVYS